MTTPLTFLDSDAQQELLLRVDRDMEPEEKRYNRRKSEILQDHIKRGLASTTVCTGHLWAEELDHLRRVARITCDAIFKIIEAKSICLEREHIEEIQRFLAEPFLKNAKLAQEALVEKENKMGLPVHVAKGPTAETRIQEAVEMETVTEVLIRSAELRRKQEATRTARKRGVVKEVLLLLGAGFIGVLGTLFTQWLTR